MTVELKYELVETEATDGNGTTLYRIRALKDFSDVKKGDLGGYVEGYHNLTQEGDAWIYDEAKVFGKSLVADNAKVTGRVRVLGHALVKDEAILEGTVDGYTMFVYDRVILDKDTHIYGDNGRAIKIS